MLPMVQLEFIFPSRNERCVQSGSLVIHGAYNCDENSIVGLRALSRVWLPKVQHCAQNAGTPGVRVRTR
jgi:hypothetical protein